METFKNKLPIIEVQRLNKVCEKRIALENALEKRVLDIRFN